MEAKILSFPPKQRNGEKLPPMERRPFEQVYQDWYPKVVRYLNGRCANQADAEDIASQTFLYAWQHYDGFDPGRAQESTWLFMIALSRWKNAMRDRREHTDYDTLENVLGSDDPGYQAVRVAEIRDRIADALETLPEETRNMVILRWFRGLSPQEIAEKMGIHPGAVRTRLSRALDRMGKLLPDLNENIP